MTRRKRQVPIREIVREQRPATNPDEELQQWDELIGEMVDVDDIDD